MGGAPLDWLIVGLGNPGAKYAGTRHNIGQDAVDAFAAREGLLLREKYKGRYGEGTIAGARCGVLIPETFMNLSGKSVAPLLQDTKTPIDRMLVVHDEVDIELGDIRYKVGGGLAGHNGLKSITAETGSKDYRRIRIGVGRPPAGDRRSISAWVLSRFEGHDDVPALIAETCTIIDEMLETGSVTNPNRCIDA